MQKSWSPAQRRYFKRFAAVFLAYMAIASGVDWLFAHQPPEGLLKYPLAAAPALPVIGMIVSMGLYLAEERDEFERAVLTQAMLWGIGLTLSLCTVWGFVESFAPIEHLPLYVVFPIFAGAFGLAVPLVRMRYR